MMEGSSGGPSGGFTRAVVQQGEFNATQYGFFGEMQLPDEELGGALEDGLEAPPEELPVGGFDEDDLPIEQLVDGEDEDEDLSLAALFARKAAVEPPLTSKHHHPHPGAPAPPPVPSLLASLRPTAGAAAASAPLPPASQPFSMGLDLSSALPRSDSKPQDELATGAQANGSQEPQWPPQQQLHPGLGAAAGPTLMQVSTPPAALRPQASLPGLSATPPRPGGVVMTAEELEARMISQARQQQQQQDGGKGLLALLKGGPAAAAAPQHQQQQKQPPPLFGTLPAGSPPPPPQQQQPPFPQQQQPFPQQQPPFPQQQQPYPQQPYPQPPPWAHPGAPIGSPPHMAPMGHNGPFVPHGMRPPMLPGGMSPGGPPPPPQGMPGMPFPPPHQMRGPYGPGVPGPYSPGPMPLGGLGPPMGPHGPAPPGAHLPPAFPSPPPPGYLMHPQAMQQPPRGAAAGPEGWPPVKPPGPPPPPLQQQQQQQAQQQRQQQRQQQGGPGFGAGFAPDHQQQQKGAQQQHQQQQQPHAYGGFGSYGSSRRGHYEGRLMAADEVDHVLRIQFAATHAGDPYAEDYYAQAYRHKYLGGRNAATFAPDALRRDAGAGLRDARHAALDGLGRFVLSNIRTPKRLMDVGGGGRAGGAAGEGADKGHAGGGGAARLEDEPMLAARILIEDCYSNLLRAEDLDRAAAADEAAGLALDAGSDAATALRRERGALLSGIVASLQLAAAPAGGEGGLGDWVFLRVMQLPKGRLMLAKALKFMCHPATGRSAPPSAALQHQQQHQQPHRQQRPWHEPPSAAAPGPGAGAEGEGDRGAARAAAVWAVLRNARELFGPAVPAAGATRAEGEKRMLAATEALAAAAAEAIKGFSSAANAADAAAALVAGLSSSEYPLLPLYPAGRAAPGSQPAWLGSVLSALLLRATELGLAAESDEERGAATSVGDGGAAAAAWRASYRDIELAVERHLSALRIAKRAGGGGEAAAEAASASGLPAAALEALRAHAAEMACVPLVRAMVSDHARGEEGERLRALLLEVAR